MKVRVDKAQMVEAVLKLWDVALDTERISKVLNIPQHEVERLLHKGLAERKDARKDRDV